MADNGRKVVVKFNTLYLLYHIITTTTIFYIESEMKSITTSYYSFLIGQTY